MVYEQVRYVQYCISDWSMRYTIYKNTYLLNRSHKTNLKYTSPSNSQPHRYIYWLAVCRQGGEKGVIHESPLACVPLRQSYTSKTTGC